MNRIFLYLLSNDRLLRELKSKYDNKYKLHTSIRNMRLGKFSLTATGAAGVISGVAKHDADNLNARFPVPSIEPGEHNSLSVNSVCTSDEKRNFLQELLNASTGMFFRTAVLESVQNELEADHQAAKSEAAADVMRGILERNYP